ncbi:MAG: AAA family ATPase [Rhodobacteraceae bacterium]|nr:AAA family ATPase [Paracoccaceae bacterium]
MIQYFEKIENLGVFANYKKPKDVESFQRFNLIYGLNGSGKTTLSRFFSDLNEGVAEGFPDLKYKINTEDGDFKQGTPYSRKIRVFNAEYVEANIGQLEGTLNPIYVIGAENKTLANTVKADEDRLEALQQQLSEQQTELGRLKKKKGRIFTDIAPKITEAAKGAVTRNYNKRNAEKAYEGLATFKQLELEELSEASRAMRQSPMDKLTQFTGPQIRLGETEKPLFDAIDLQIAAITNILQKSATSSAIERLTSNPALAAWVEAGRALHAHSADVKCEYCQQKVPEAREAELAAHFNTSDANLKSEIERAIEDNQAIYEGVERISVLSDQAFYPEFRKEYAVQAKVLLSQKSDIIELLERLEKALNEKLTRRTESYDLTFPLVTSGAWGDALSSINDLIKGHNTETDSFEQRLEANFEKIETHFLSTIEKEVKDVSASISAVEKTIGICTDGDPDSTALGVDDLTKRIAENRAKLSNSQQAAAELSEKLAAFLGRDDLKFEPEGEGYRIMRFGRAAKRLSEGEKTAITFLYFVVSLGDRDFDLTEGIVVIDDPISSLDSSSVYQAFAYLKNAVKNAKQIFLLTHNFEFLKLLLNWFQNIPSPKKNGKSTYWMLHCSLTPGGARETEIRPLDKVLLQNKNEFAYLLKELMKFESDGTIQTAYPIPNIIRKVLETFLEQHSTGQSLYSKLENLNFEEAKKTALYKFANDLSHPTYSGLDPALVGETQTNIKHLLEMIEEVAPIHFKALTETIGSIEET